MGRRTKATNKIKEAITAYINGEGSQANIASKYGISRTYLRDEMVKYKRYGPSVLEAKSQNNAYSEEIKKKAVEDYLNGQGSLIQISVKYGLRNKLMLQRWIEVYNSGKGFRRKMSGGSHMKEARLTTMEERIQIAKDCIANGCNYGETALKYKVSYQQVYQWAKKFKEMGATGLEDRRGKRLKDQTPRTREEELEIEVAKLKHELYMTQMERDLLKKLDEIERREAYRK